MLKVFKKVGQTPLQLLNELREDHPELKDEVLSYAGRLDPMAEGEMLIMVGKEENSRREEFLGFDKEYEADILFGFTTDTFDVLGKVERGEDLDFTSGDLKRKLKKLKKIKEIDYPSFSSKVVKGKPLFQWYREGKIDEVDVPKRDIKVKKVKLLETKEIKGEDLWRYINFAVGEVDGDFRQEEILDLWHQLLNEEDGEYRVAKVRFKVSTGTYIRSLSHIVGEEFGGACLLKLRRTKIFN